MKSRALPLLLLCLALAGCEALSDASSAVREKVSNRSAAQTHVYTADTRRTYEAARVALDQMGYRVTRGGPAQGQIDAVSGLSNEDSLRSSRQLSLKVRLKSTLDGGTEATVTIDEIIEADSRDRAGQGTAAPLRDTPQYDVLFRRIQQALDTPKPK